MKFSFTYLLLLCVLSFKAYAHITIDTGKNVSNAYSSKKNNPVNVDGKINQRQIDLQQHEYSLFCDDDNTEEEETVISRKEIHYINICPIENDLAAVSNILHSFKKFQPVGHLFDASLSRKYIALGVFRI